MVLRPALLALPFLFSQPGWAQLSAGVGMMPGDNGDAIKENVMKALTGTTTIFFYRAADAAQLDQWTALMKEVWTVTPLELHPFSDAANYAGDLEKPGSPYSFLMLEASTAQQRFENLTIDLALWIPSEKDNWYGGYYAKRREFGRVPLDTDMSTVEYWSTHSAGEGIYEYMYGPMVIDTWKPELVAKMLQPINQALVQKVNMMSRPFVDKEEITKVLNKTLYFCDYSLEQWDYNLDKAFLAKEQKDLLAGYGGKYKVVTVDELCTMLKSGDEPFYFVITARQGASMRLWVQRSDTGKMVYAAADNWAFTERMFKALGKGKLP